MNLARFMMLKHSVAETDADPEKYLSTDNLRKILKAALPHQSKFIDENDQSAFHYLLDEIEGFLLAELQKIVEGKDIDKAATVKAKLIMDAVTDADQERLTQVVPEEIRKTISE
jgi:hypothetical protein